MATAGSKPLIQLVGQCAGIRHRDIKSTVGLEYTSDLGECHLPSVNVFQPVVGYHGIEDGISERQFTCITLDEAGTDALFHVETDSKKRVAGDVKASTGTGEVENPGTGGKVVKDLTHVYCLARVTGLNVTLPPGAQTICHISPVFSSNRNV